MLSSSHLGGNHFLARAAGAGGGIGRGPSREGDGISVAVWCSGGEAARALGGPQRRTPGGRRTVLGLALPKLAEETAGRNVVGASSPRCRWDLIGVGLLAYDEKGFKN